MIVVVRSECDGTRAQFHDLVVQQAWQVLAHLAIALEYS